MMMPRDRMSNPALQRICALCALAFATLSLTPVGAAAQGDTSVFIPGPHELKLERADGPAIGYTISIPRGYSPATPVPFVLALHFGLGGGSAAGAGGDVVRALIGPGLTDLHAIIVAPDSVRGNW